MRISTGAAGARRAGIASLALLLTAHLLIPLLARGEEKFDPLTYFVERARQQQAAERVAPQPAPARAVPPPAPEGGDIQIWVIAGIAAVIGVIVLLGWLKPSAGTVVPRIDREIGREFREFVNDYGEDGEHLEQLERIRKKREERAADMLEGE
ncbi:MAG: hypothetical protein PHN82_12195 [bacterium]|nr:hypothetical protein [bacterium]